MTWQPPEDWAAPAPVVAPQKPPGWKMPKALKIFLAVVAVACVVIAVVGHNKGGSDGPSSSNVSPGCTSTNPYKVTYDMTAPDGDYTIQAAAGTRQGKFTAAHEEEFCGSKGAFVYVSVQNDDETGTVSCTVKLNDVIVLHNSSAGGFVIASCDGRL